MMSTTRRRVYVPVRERARILSVQRNRCLYCGNEFGSIIERRGIPELVVQQWDHFIPVLGGGMEDMNIVAACSVCNSIKHQRVFDAVEDATRYIREKRKGKGYAS